MSPRPTSRPGGRADFTPRGPNQAATPRSACSRQPLGCPCLTEKSGGELAVMKHRRTDLLWLLGVSAAFTSSVIAFTPLHQGFSWDEVVYVSQISQHTPSMPWAAERARGMPLLVAPVTLLTASPTALRLYLASLAGLGLFVGLLAWRGLLPAWVLALAGVVFGGLWVAQAEAPLVFPNFWAAIGGVSGVGLFLPGVERGASRRYLFFLLTGPAPF